MVASGTDIVVPRMCLVCATGLRKSSDNGVHKDHEFSQLVFRARSKTSRHAWVSPPDHSRPSCVDGLAAGFYPAGFHHGGFNDRSVQTRFIALGGSGAGTRDLVADDFISLPQASPDLCRHPE